jgi:hypothetical protein
MGSFGKITIMSLITFWPPQSSIEDNIKHGEDILNPIHVQLKKYIKITFIDIFLITDYECLI